FQAEDGIRDPLVTGVQTCALPIYSSKLTGDAATGVSILRRALEEPLRQLAINGGKDGSVVVEGVRRAQKEHQSDKYGFNVLTDQIGRASCRERVESTTGDGIVT